MPISLYDPRSQTKREVAAAAPFELTCAEVEGGPPCLSALRQSVILDLLQRQPPLRAHAKDATLDAALEQAAAGDFGGAYEAETLRYWLGSAHYRSSLSLGAPEGQGASFAPLAECERRVAHLYATKQRLRELPSERVVPVQSAPAEALSGLSDSLSEALEDDLDTPRALAAVEVFLLGANALCDAAWRKQGRVNVSAVEAANAGFASIKGLLGLGGDEPSAFLRRVRDRRARQRQLDLDVVEQLVARRAAARADKDFATADRLQSELLALGVSLLDSPAGTSWTIA